MYSLYWSACNRSEKLSLSLSFVGALFFNGDVPLSVGTAICLIKKTQTQDRLIYYNFTDKGMLTSQFFHLHSSVFYY